jgi:hypothetical protein
MERTSERSGRKVRHPVEIEAVALRAGGGKTPVTLTNFSNEGCRIEGVTGFHVGERLQIALPRMGQVKAQVRWTASDSVGVRFIAESDF